MDKELEEILDEFCGSNKMYRWIVDDVVDSAIDYEGTDEEKVVARLETITEHGCASGTVSSLIYYDDTTDFFNNFYDEIYNFLADMEANGLDPIKLINNEVDAEDILMCTDYSKNIIAWRVYEYVCDELLNILYNE